MARIDPETAWDFADAIKSVFGKTSTKRRATVQNVDRDGTIWVQLPGANDVTPIATTGANVQPGDTVLTELRGTQLHITQNNTDPAVGGKAARSIAKQETKHAERMAKQAQEIADEAQAVANATNQHFWDDDNGAHVTDVTQADWKAAEADSFSDLSDTKPYHNLLMNSLGILLRRALNNLVSISKSAIAFYDGLGNAAANIVARFGADGAQIGLTDESHMELDYHSLQLIDKEGNTYFHVSDLRDASGKVEMVDTFTGDGSTTEFLLTLKATDTNYTVTVSDSSGGSIIKATGSIRFSTAPTSGSTITATYTSESTKAKAYTFGVRLANSKVGPFSVAEGSSNEASGSHCHAEGYNGIARGPYSHSEGVVARALGVASHAEGNSTHANGDGGHAEGLGTWASGAHSHAEGNNTKAQKNEAHAEGYASVASGLASHAEGSSTQAVGRSAHAEGYSSEETSNAFIKASGIGSHAEGAVADRPTSAAYLGVKQILSSGDGAHVEGFVQAYSSSSSNVPSALLKASGNGSHAEGYIDARDDAVLSIVASGQGAHAEGLVYSQYPETEASGSGSHAEGIGTHASQAAAHAEGQGTIAGGYYSHAQNLGTFAFSGAQTAIGAYNVADLNGDYALIIGNGTADDARSNALAVTWDGDIETAKDTAWITLNSAIKYRIHHGVCYVCGDSVSGGTNVGTSGTIVGTLPVEARPSVTVSGAASTKSNTDNGQYAIDSFGVIKVWNLRTNSPYWCFTTSYPVG